VVSGVDPKRTFLTLCDAENVPPEFLWRIRNLRTRGTLAKVHLALSALPAFGGTTKAMLAGRVRIAPDLEYLERAFDHAKYGEWSREPWIEFTLPSLLDPSLAPEGGHVLSGYVQWVPNGLDGPRPATGSRQPATGSRQPGTGGRERAAGSREPADDLLEAVLDTLERYAPALRGLVVAAEIVTPADMDAGWGLTGGHIFHGELSLDQAFTMRPLLGWGHYETPIPRLYLCGSGTHPGTGLTGGSGANAARVISEGLR
jgi:phytoene dehydrogenase-like protein